MKFFRRLLKNSFLICSVYTLIFTLILYSSNAYTLKNEYSDKIETYLSQSAGKMNDYLILAQELLGSYLTNPDVISYSNSTTPSSHNIVELNYLLRQSIPYAITPFYTVALTKISDNRVVSNVETMTLSYFREKMGLSEEQFSSVIGALGSDSFKSTGYFISQSEKEDIFTLVFHSYESGPLYFFFSFRLNDIIRTLDSGTVVMGIDGNVAYAIGEFAAEQIGQIFQGQTLRGNSIFFLPASSPSPLGDLQYAYIINQNEYLSELNRNVLILLSTGLLILLLGYFFAYLLTKRTYSPIKVLLAKIKNAPLNDTD